MFNISTFWIFLLGIRPFSEFLGIPAVTFTALITGLQVIHLFIFLEKTCGKMHKHYFFLILLILFTAYNFATLATVNIVISIILLKNESLKKISLICFLSILTALFIYLSLLSLTILKDELIRMPKGVGHTFGFDNTNGIGAFAMQITLITYVFIASHFRNTIPIYIFLFPNYMIYKLSLGRTPFYTIMIFFLLILIFSLFKNTLWKLKKAVTFLPILLFLCTIIACKIYEQYPILDVIFTTRFSKNSVHLDTMTPLNYLIGYKLPSGPMDSAYLDSLFAGGILSVYIFISVSMRGISEFKFSELTKYMPFVICMLISGFTENTFSSFSLQTLLFYKVLCNQFPIKGIKRRYLYADI
ncbi:hypothetical protein [Treponema brennaborense]|uniref:O-antigen polymerase n=1 Tax=Treponema brennaborense (strain DSM 12168 / CIP 105900 / DD5/3) TaxID=906968 RepID=F4LK09_TREBD|nr:hypothetical protein [Treponema brennaborense]AEE17471.1 hypothetical protein Trebr_2056 [Treponema brennaborense DSM 12168]